MMLCSARFYVASLLLRSYLSAEWVAADGIEYVQDRRRTWMNRQAMDVSGDYGPNFSRSTPYDETPLVSLVSWTNRSLASTLNSNSFSAVMTATNVEHHLAEMIVAYDMECVRFDMTFRLKEPMVMTLTGSTVGKIPHYLGGFNLYSGDGGELIFSPPVDQSEFVDIFYESILETGDYRLIAELHDYAEERKPIGYSISLSADFTPIPEPSSVLLLMAGGGGLLCHRRSKRRRMDRLSSHHGFQ
ncbi:MAG: PEP-CTERM sorting domain-containing protein [Kiritimatiellales bacterium]|nr:PEP-CTERM sorting domain-containing protein [Kiritimatiellales bacterium]